MDKEFELLKQFPLFASISEKRLASAALLWEAKTVEAGKTLWWQGEPANEFLFVISGSLRVHIADKTIAEVQSGEMLGEAAAFTKDQRTASVTTISECVLLGLSTLHLETLRTSHPVVYDLILDACLQKMARRVHEMGRKIAGLARGDHKVPQRQVESAIGKWWKRLTGAGTQDPPPATGAIRKLPKLKNADKVVLQQILGVMTPHWVAKQKTIFLEGDPGDSVFLLVEGCVDVVRNVRGGKAQCLATLYPGALFGTGSLLLRERRNAACVASEQTDCWVYELNVTQHKEIQAEAGRIWRESLLAALSFQLRNADDRLIALLNGGQPSKTDYDKIRGSLAGFQG